MIALLLAGLLAAAPTVSPITTKAKEHEELLVKLKRDIFKVERAIAETERLIAKSRNTPYLPDLQLRLAELYVEKSRYVYYLQAESRPGGNKGALVSPETRLLKNKAIQLYDRLLREYPDFKDADKAQFYLAHEQRELGQFDEMLKSLGELIRKWPQSPLRLEAEQILGDHFFDRADLPEAEKHYQAVLSGNPSTVQDLARYKLGWIRINQGKHAEAVTFFEAAAASPTPPTADAQKALNVKREALLDLVYSYTEARPGKGAMAYFEKLSDSRSTYALALDKLGNRYFIKQQYEFAIPALRKLLEIHPDPELDKERAQKLYDSVKAAKGKVATKPEDVHYLVRAAVLDKVNPDLDEKERKKGLSELEVMARDLATQMHLSAQKKPEKQAYLDAAAGYAEYLALFRPAAQVRTMMRNRADALFAAAEYPKAARQFEELTEYESNKDAAGYDSALYGALLSHHTSLKPGNAEKLNAFEVADARQALKLLGAHYLTKFPRSEHAVEVKFNIARAYYDDGDFKKSAELFTDFALKHPDYKDSAVAGHLALDSLRQQYDFKELEATGRRFLAARLPASFHNDVRKILSQTKSEALDELALRSSQETGDVMTGLLKVAEENKGQDIGEKALYGAFAAARDRRELSSERELGSKFVSQYPKSQYLPDVLQTLGRHAAEVGRFDEAAVWLETLGGKLGADAKGVEGYLGGARLRSALGEHREAIRDFQAAADAAGGRRAEVLVLLAQEHLKAKDKERARATAEQVLRLDKQNAAAAAIVAEVAATSKTPNVEPLVPLLTAVAKGPQGQTEEAAKGLWYLGDGMYQSFVALPPQQLEQKVSQLQRLEGVLTQVAQAGSPEWAVAALWRLALAYKHMAQAVEGTPMPAGLSAAESEQFRAVLGQQAAPLKKRAESTFEVCASRATSLEVFTSAALGCRIRAESASAPLPAAAGSRGSSPDEALKKLESQTSAAGFEALGQAYLEGRQLSLAQLAYSRATELEESRPAAHNGLGFALWLQGDAMGAKASFRKALEVDPSFDKARANLSALRCRFGDKEGAQKELGAMKDSGVSGADVDAEWRACK